MALTPRAQIWPRNPDEPHRVASPLELLTDLCYVVAIAQSASALHHAASHGEVGHGLLFFAISFFAIWLAWLNFAWYNSAYDNDDVLHRLLTLLQVFGSLVLAAGVARIFEGDFRLGVAGYSIMRIGLILMWLRAAHGHPERRETALTFALGLALVQSLWIGYLFLNGGFWLPIFIGLALIDLAVPIVAEGRGQTPWHPHHIAERYGLFLIIVLGETVLSTTVAIQQAIDAEHPAPELAYVVIGGVLIVFSAWWLYFARDDGDVLRDNAVAFVWGYGHYLIFGSMALLGAGLAVRVDFWSDESHISDATSAALITVPVAVFLAALWVFSVRLHDPGVQTWGPFAVAIVAVLASTATSVPELLAGLVCVGLLAVELRLTGGSGDRLDVGRSH